VKRRGKTGPGGNDPRPKRGNNYKTPWMKQREVGEVKQESSRENSHQKSVERRAIKAASYME